MEQAKARLHQDLDERDQAIDPRLEDRTLDRADDISPLDEAETRMRESLLRLSANAPDSAGGHMTRSSSMAIRRRFVRDGEVDVTVLRRGTEPGALPPAQLGRQLEAAKAALADEAAARNQIARSLEEASGIIRTLQTKLQHAEMARDEAITALEQRAAEAAVPEQPDTDPQRVAALEEALHAAKEQLNRERQAHEATKRQLSNQERLVAELSREPKKPIEEAFPFEQPQPVAWWLNTKPKPKRRKASPASSEGNEEH
jgi:hypothetical protein